MQKPSPWALLWQMGKIIFAKTLPAPPELEDMIRRSVGAIQAGDGSAYRATLHPASLARMNDENRAVFEEIIQKELAKKIPADYKIGVIRIDEKQALFMDEYLDYPVRPTYVVKISYKNGPNSYSAAYWQAAQEAGRWYIVMTPPDLSVPGMKEVIAQKRGLTAADDQKIEQLYYHADTGFLAEIRELVYNNRRIDAINRCKSKLKLDLTEAVQFVDRVAKP